MKTEFFVQIQKTYGPAGFSRETQKTAIMDMNYFMSPTDH